MRAMSWGDGDTAKAEIGHRLAAMMARQMAAVWTPADAHLADTARFLSGKRAIGRATRGPPEALVL